MAAASVTIERFEAVQRELERALTNPLGSSVAARTSTGCAAAHAEISPRAISNGGDLRRIAEDGRTRLRGQISRDVLPMLEAYFAEARDRSWMDEAEDATIEDVTLQEAAALLRALAEWERKLTRDTAVNALVSTLCGQLTADSQRRVARFKSEQSPEDSPDYRAVATDLVMFETMIYLATLLAREAARAELVRLRDHHAKTALLSALAVIKRAEEATDMFAHFDVAAMLVSVEDVVVVISRTVAVIDRERDTAHPHVETVSEHVVRDFARGMKRLAPTYLRMLHNTISTRDHVVPQFALSIVRVLVQVARLTRIVHHLTQDPTLMTTAEDIANDVLRNRDRLAKIMAADPAMLNRLDEALGALGVARPSRGPAP